MEQLLPGLSAAPNLHPMAVHFPIAFWVAATGAWAVAVFSGSDAAWRFGRWLHLLGLVSAAAALALGFWAADAMGHDSPGHDRVHVHRDFMLVASGLALAVTAVSWWRTTPTKALRAGLTIGSVLLMGVMTLGADRGAELVYRYGVGVADEPAHDGDHEHADEPAHDGDHEH